VFSQYPQLTDPTAHETTLRILNGALSSDKLDWLLFSKNTLRLVSPEERKAAAAAKNGGKSKLYGRASGASFSDAEQSWAIDGYGASDHCFVCFDLTPVDD
jgi:hypothetical protein